MLILPKGLRKRPWVIYAELEESGDYIEICPETEPFIGTDSDKVEFIKLAHERAKKQGYKIKNFDVWEAAWAEVS